MSRALLDTEQAVWREARYSVYNCPVYLGVDFVLSSPCNIEHPSQKRVWRALGAQPGGNIDAAAAFDRVSLLNGIKLSPQSPDRTDSAGSWHRT